MDRNRPLRETQVVPRVLERLRAGLPPDWSIRERRPGRKGPDLLLEIRAPDGKRASMVCEFKREIEPRNVAALNAQLAEWGVGARFVGAAYLSERTRELFEKAGVNYGDTTGNLLVELRTPGLFVRTSGAQENPWREQGPLASLRGRGAARAVRALCDFRPPNGIRELAERAGASAPTLSRVSTLLEKEAIITRERGRITDISWPALIRRWAKDYSFMTSNTAGMYLDPRGLPSFPQRLADSRVRCAITGSLAAGVVAGVAPARLGTVYVEDIEAAAKALRLRPTESGANVVLLAPFDAIVFERTWMKERLTYAALPQVAVDLLTSPGRGPAEGEALIAWMEKNEDAWRH